MVNWIKSNFSADVPFLSLLKTIRSIILHDKVVFKFVQYDLVWKVTNFV